MFSWALKEVVCVCVCVCVCIDIEALGSPVAFILQAYFFKVMFECIIIKEPRSEEEKLRDLVPTLGHWEL